MRLVDVADIEKFIRENVCVIGDDHLLLVAGDDGRWHEALPLVKTAYDIGKVAEELEENSSRYTKKYTTPYGNNGYRDTKAISIHKAIKIVKQGCVGKDVE